MNTKGLLFALCLPALYLHAGIMPSQSRIIYHAQDKDRSLMLANTNDYPVIVQNWIDKGEGTPESKNIPFISIPPVFRLEPTDVKGIRVIYNQAPLANDIESLFWFNIYEVPPEKKGAVSDNSVLVTMNTQIKLFFRPEGITEVPEQAIKQVRCSKQSPTEIACYNPSPIHLSVIDINTDSVTEKGQGATGDDFMLLPKSKKSFYFKDSIKSLYKLNMVYINDFGEMIRAETHLHD